MGIGDHLRSRKLLLVAVVAAATFAFGSIVFAELRSNTSPGRATFIARISPRGAEGGFDAVTTIRGERPGAASCTVQAFDVYGRTVGSRVFDLGRLAPGEARKWRGRVRVDARVERMSIHCR